MSKSKFPAIEMTLVGLIGLFGCFAVASSFLTPPKIQKTVYANAKLQKRMPASATSSSVPLDKTATMLTLNIGCHLPSEVSVRALQVRLVHQGCDKEEAVSGLAVQNLTNGHNATVFKTGKLTQSEHTTDYIQLAQGKNKILLKTELENGKISQQEIVLLNRISTFR